MSYPIMNDQDSPTDHYQTPSMPHNNRMDNPLVHYQDRQDGISEGGELPWYRILGIILATGLVILIAFIAWMIIPGLAELGSDLVWNIMRWVKDGTIIPSNKRGFESFISLGLTTGFIWLMLYFLKKK